MTSLMPTAEIAAIVTEQGAIEAGYTKAIIADCSTYTLELLISPDADLDGRFAAFDRNEREMLTVNGWLFDINPE